MSSLGYSDFSGGSGGAPNGANSNSNGSSDGYIASKRKNKTVKAFDAAYGPRPGPESGLATTSTPESGGRVNPKLEKLKASIAKIHAESSDDDDESDDTGAAATSVLPTYPGQPQANAASKNLKVSPPIADAGSGISSNGSGAIAPPTTSEGRTHQPMFSMSQQFANRYGADDASGVEQFKMKAPSTYAAQYYKQYAPYNYNRLSNELSSPGANNDEFIEKLNYIIHLLEEQHSERTEHVMEELVLYCFLGVFIIFIVDSFARAGKYTR
jgi:hypothetical protein